jgi:hypothetical protein
LVDKKEKSKTLGNKDDKGREERTRKWPKGGGGTMNILL